MFLKVTLEANEYKVLQHVYDDKHESFFRVHKNINFGKGRYCCPHSPDGIIPTAVIAVKSPNTRIAICLDCIIEAKGIIDNLEMINIGKTSEV